MLRESPQSDYDSPVRPTQLAIFPSDAPALASTYLPVDPRERNVDSAALAASAQEALAARAEYRRKKLWKRTAAPASTTMDFAPLREHEMAGVLRRTLSRLERAVFPGKRTESRRQIDELVQQRLRTRATASSIFRAPLPVLRLPPPPAPSRSRPPHFKSLRTKSRSGKENRRASGRPRRKGLVCSLSESQQKVQEPTTIDEAVELLASAHRLLDIDMNAFQNSQLVFQGDDYVEGLPPKTAHKCCDVLEMNKSELVQEALDEARGWFSRMITEREAQM